MKFTGEGLGGFAGIGSSAKIDRSRSGLVSEHTIASAPNRARPCCIAKTNFLQQVSIAVWNKLGIGLV